MTYLSGEINRLQSRGRHWPPCANVPSPAVVLSTATSSSCPLAVVLFRHCRLHFIPLGLPAQLFECRPVPGLLHRPPPHCIVPPDALFSQYPLYPPHEPHDILVRTTLPPHEPYDVLVRTTLPRPGPFPLGASLRSEATAAMEGDLSPDGLKWRTIAAVQGFNAPRSSGRSHPGPALMPTRIQTLPVLAGYLVLSLMPCPMVSQNRRHSSI
jgi:hypothetical protein